MSWFKNLLPKISSTGKKGVPEGIWSKCDDCASIIYKAELDNNLGVCPKCDAHLRLGARERMDLFLDEKGREELAADVVSVDRLKFRDSKKYKDRLHAAQKATGEKSALLAYMGQLKGMPVVVCAFDFKFIGGSMSAAVGEKFVIAVETAREQSLPLICFAASGGARMQEGLFSLFQMGKTAAALARYQDIHKPYISVLCDPTMGGVSASLATLGDIIIAEPNALIGFSGPRVIEQTIRETLPEGFQRSEFLLAHGAIDMIVDRRHMRDTVASLLAKLGRIDLSLLSQNGAP